MLAVHKNSQVVMQARRTGYFHISFNIYDHLTYLFNLWQKNAVLLSSFWCKVAKKQHTVLHQSPGPGNFLAMRVKTSTMQGGETWPVKFAPVVMLAIILFLACGNNLFWIELDKPLIELLSKV